MPFRGVYSRLGVKGVENGLDHKHVGSAVFQSADRFGVCGSQISEADIPCRRVVDIRRYRKGSIGRAKYARNEFSLTLPFFFKIISGPACYGSSLRLSS